MSKDDCLWLSSLQEEVVSKTVICSEPLLEARLAVTAGNKSCNNKYLKATGSLYILWAVGMWCIEFIAFWERHEEQVIVTEQEEEEFYYWISNCAVERAYIDF